MNWWDRMILVFWMLNFTHWVKPFPLSSFTFKRLFSSSLSAITVVSPAYLRLLIFLPAILMETVRDFVFQFSSVAQSCTTLCDPMDCSMPGFPVHHHPQGLLKLMSIELVMPSNHLILSSCLQSFPASDSFPVSQFFTSGGQSIGVSAPASVLWESQCLGKLIGSLGVPKERGVWNSQGGRKDKLFFSPHSLGLYNNNVSCLRTVFGFNLLLS